MKNKFKIIITLIIGIIVGTLGYVVADDVISIINANQIGFSSEKTSKTNIQEAVDELYDISKIHCPDGRLCDIGNAKNATIVPKGSGDTYDAIVYLDPTDLTKACNASNSNSSTGLKKGCMKWYAYNTRTVGGVTVYDLILDHNTTARIAWANQSDFQAAGGTWNSTSGSENYSTRGPVTIARELYMLTEKEENNGSGWKVTPRMITVDEIAHIVGVDAALNWSSANAYGTNVSANQSAAFYFDGTGNSYSGWGGGYATTPNSSNYTWLYDYTYKCTGGTPEYGCEVSDDTIYGNADGTYGYWTSTKSKYGNGDARIWVVYKRGQVQTDLANNQGYGLRPVISITK